MSFGWLTASVDWDNVGGDDGIQAFLEIEDQSGDSIKRAGAFTIELFDVDNEKGKANRDWTFTPEAAAKYWNSIPRATCSSSHIPTARQGRQGGAGGQVELSEGGSFDAMRIIRVHH